MRFLLLVLGIAFIVGISRTETYQARVDYVIDGDTVVLADGSKVRLLQINAPEKGECGYEEAKQELKKLVEGKVVKIELDPLFGDHDKYQRVLAYIHVGHTNVNVQLQQQGYVDTFFYRGVEGKYAHQMHGPRPCST